MASKSSISRLAIDINREYQQTEFRKITIGITRLFISWHCSCRVEEERKRDLAERDALSERLKQKDKGKTRNIVEKSNKKVSVWVIWVSGVCVIWVGGVGG